MHSDEPRIVELLRELIALKGVREEMLEARMGWARGELGELAESRRPLAVNDLLSLLTALDVRPADFFARIYGFETREGDGNGSINGKGEPDRMNRRFADSERVVAEALARRAARLGSRTKV